MPETAIISKVKALRHPPVDTIDQISELVEYIADTGNPIVTCDRMLSVIVEANNRLDVAATELGDEAEDNPRLLPISRAAGRIAVAMHMLVGEYRRDITDIEDAAECM